MKEIKPVFLATTKESKETFMPFYREMARRGWDVMVYNRGPVCVEIKDRNIVITSDEISDKEIIDQFGCKFVKLTKSMTIEEGFKLILDTIYKE